MLVEVSTKEFDEGGLSGSKGLLVVVTIWLVEVGGSGPRVLFRVTSTTLDDVGIELRVDIGLELSGARVGERETSTGLIEVETMRARISVSVSSHATGTPSFQTVSVGFDSVAVKKLYAAGDVLIVPVKTQTLVSDVIAMLERT